MIEPTEPGALRLAPAFNFRVTLRRAPGPPSGEGSDAPPDLLGDGGFQECSGLEVEMDVQELREGGRNDGVVRLVGRGKYSNLVLKRGMFHPPEGSVNAEFWRWLQAILSGTRPVARYDGTVEVLDPRGEPEGRALATWSFARALPVKVRGPELNARTGEVAIEELHLAHEGLRLEP
jgi:phage tail-like protein